MSSIIFLVALENLRVVAEVLLVWSPSLGVGIFLEVWVVPFKVSSPHVIVVDSVLNILHVVVSHGHAFLTEFVHHFILRVLSVVLDALVEGIQLFPKGFFSLLIVYLTQLLHLELLLSNQVLLFLRQIT